MCIIKTFHHDSSFCCLSCTLFSPFTRSDCTDGSEGHSLHPSLFSSSFFSFCLKLSVSFHGHNGSPPYTPETQALVCAASQGRGRTGPDTDAPGTTCMVYAVVIRVFLGTHARHRPVILMSNAKPEACI